MAVACTTHNVGSWLQAMWVAPELLGCATDHSPVEKAQWSINGVKSELYSKGPTNLCLKGMGNVEQWYGRIKEHFFRKIISDQILGEIRTCLDNREI